MAANQAETLDDHMNDNNWTKLVNIGKSICTIIHLLPVKTCAVDYLSAIQESYSWAARLPSQFPDAV
jgi:hypothetical protein